MRLPNISEENFLKTAGGLQSYEVKLHDIGVQFDFRHSFAIAGDLQIFLEKIWEDLEQVKLHDILVDFPVQFDLWIWGSLGILGDPWERSGRSLVRS